jgi:hypothetical protein
MTIEQVQELQRFNALVSLPWIAHNIALTLRCQITGRHYMSDGEARTVATFCFYHKMHICIITDSLNYWNNGKSM